MRLSTVHRLLAAAVMALAAAMPVAAADSPQNTPTRVEANMLDGSRYSLADSRGEITVLSLWSPESLASRKCIWELQRFASAYQPRGVRTIAVSTLADADELRVFVTKRKLTVPVAILGEHDLGRLDETRLPIVLVFDQDGKLQSTHAGLFSMRILERMVTPLVRP